MASSAAAASKVLNTTELLEAILLELDMQTLLHAQRVNHTFNNTISKSLHLQRALWFAPLPPTSVSAMSDRRNPLLLKHKTRLAITTLTSYEEEDMYFEPTGDPFNIVDFAKMPPTTNGSWRRMLPLQQISRPESWHMTFFHEHPKCHSPTYYGDQDAEGLCCAEESGAWHLIMRKRNTPPTLGEILDFALRWMQENDVDPWQDLSWREKWNVWKKELKTKG